MEQATQQVTDTAELESTVHYFKGGALDVTNTVLDTADIITGSDEIFYVNGIVADLAAQGVDLDHRSIYDTLRRGVDYKIVRELGGGAFQWVKKHA